MAGLLVIMGSGETAPTMVKPHRSLFERVGERPAAVLDTPYGFQSNADDISARAVGYFAASVGRTVEVVSWRTALPAGLARERAAAVLRAAGWIFAGPGSPTYALRHWRNTPVETALHDVLARDGVLVLASAAALTLGSHTVPVYEIYKAGIDPHWETGLDLVSSVTGLPAVVIPHYDNAEGGNHDTRYCYLGEGRLARLEADLPEESFVLGVDEHTAVILDPGTATATVVGNGTMTIRRRGHSVVYPSGSVVDFATLGADEDAAPSSASGAPTVTASDGSAATTGQATSPTAQPQPTSLLAAADEITDQFDNAFAARDVDGCVEAILALERALLEWAADTLTSDEGERARARLREMVVRLGELARVGVRDPRELVAPFVTALLEVRGVARKAKDFATSDRVRDVLTDAGVEVRDTPQGVEWQLTAT
jgi:cyanophycinase-like exopeptidase